MTDEQRQLSCSPGSVGNALPIKITAKISRAERTSNRIVNQAPGMNRVALGVISKAGTPLGGSRVV